MYNKLKTANIKKIDIRCENNQTNKIPKNVIRCTGNSKENNSKNIEETISKLNIN